MTAAKASPELMPNTAMATAMASSKLLLAVVDHIITSFRYLKINTQTLTNAIKKHRIPDI